MAARDVLPRFPALLVAPPPGFMQAGTPQRGRARRGIGERVESGKGGLEGRSVGVDKVESRWNLASLEMGPGNRRNSVVPVERRQD